MTQEQIDGGAVKEVERLALAAAGRTVAHDSGWSTTPLFDTRPKEPNPEALALSTLGGLADYLAEDPDSNFTEARVMFITVDDPATVSIHTGAYGKFAQRGLLVQAKSPTRPFVFSRWMDPETFIIGLKTAFVQGEDLATVLRFVGNLKSEAVQTVEDDGVSQRATVRKGIARVADEVAPQLVRLAPYRTFVEIEQPTSPFVLRLRGDGHSLPECALMEADGGAWRVEAAKSIKSALESMLETRGIEKGRVAIFA